MKVAILEPAPVHHGWFHLQIRTPHLGPPVLAARLRSAGHQATVYSEFVAPIPLNALSAYDAIGISANTTLTHQRAYALADYVRRTLPGRPLIAGGHHATMNVDETLRHVDYVVRGYAEESLPALIAELAAGVKTPRAAGVSYVDSRTLRRVDNPSQTSTSIATAPDLDSIAGYRQLVRSGLKSPQRYAAQLPLSFFSRGCAFTCDFCAIPIADNPRMSYRTPAEVIDDLRYQIDFYSTRRFHGRFLTIWLIDDNFGQHHEPAEEFLAKLAEARLECRFVVQSRVEIAKHAKLLRLMKEARFHSIYVGIESISNQSLKSLMKRSNREKITLAVDSIQREGINVVALLMFGNDHETRGVADNTAAFLREHGIRHICPQITVPYPGTGFYSRVAQEGRLFFHDYRFANWLPMYFPDSMRPSRTLGETIRSVELHYTWKRHLDDVIHHKDLKNIIAHVAIKRSRIPDLMRRMIPVMQRLESPYYDNQDTLDTVALRRAQDSGALQERVEAILAPELRQLAPSVNHDLH
jgi:radical SAM superfamily enzyme YgiQ (UPF0313 family)